MEQNSHWDIEILSYDLWQKRVDQSYLEASWAYNPGEWTPCPEDCQQCGGNYRLRPHRNQTKLEDRMNGFDFIKLHIFTSP